MFHFTHEIPRKDIVLGLVGASDVDMAATPDGFESVLNEVLAVRAAGLGEREEARRAAARDVLRNGSYKPTGRGKPASEYLLRAARQENLTFPRINGPVDICNYISLKHVVPISLWDLDRAGSNRFLFRLGRSGEHFVFNEGGQRIEVEDLLVGCRVVEGNDPPDEPIVNPVKDSLATKTTPQTRRIAACIYAAADVFNEAALSSICEEFASLLSECGDRASSTFGLLRPASALEL